MAIILGLNINGERDLQGGRLSPLAMCRSVPHHSNQPITATYHSGQLTNQSPHRDEPKLQPSTYDLRRPKEPIDQLQGGTPVSHYQHKPKRAQKAASKFSSMCVYH